MRSYGCESRSRAIYSILLCALLLVRGGYGVSVTNSSIPSPTTSFVNATTSTIDTTSTLAQNATTSSRIWSLWSTAHYPADCEAYYTTPSANSSLLPGWNASVNAAFFSSAYKCLASLSSYASASKAFESTNVYLRFSTSLSHVGLGVETETISTTSYRLTTLCDGIPRAVTGVNASSTAGTYTSTITYRSSAAIQTYISTVSILTAPYTTPPPTCSLDCKACSMLQAAVLYSVSSYSVLSDYAGLNNITWASDCPYPPSNLDDDNTIIYDDVPDCEVYIWSAQMFYWPVTTINGDVCNKTGTTITPTPTGVGPNTYNLNGSILTSPSVYVSFFDVTYNAVSSNQTVTYITNTLIAFRPTDIQSQRGYRGSNSNYSFNYADLPPNPVPSSAWFGQADCVDNKDGCVPMETTSYAPALAFPSMFYQLSDINPKWTGKSCNSMGNYMGIWDPPVACQPTSSAAGPGPAPVAYTTSSSSSQSSQAKPSSTPIQPPPQTSTTGAQTLSSQSTQSSYTAEAESTESTSSTNALLESSYAEPTSSSMLNTQLSNPTSPMSSSDPRTASTESSNDVGGIIASAIGMTQTSTDPTTEGDASSQQITEGSLSLGASSSSSTDPAGVLASVLGYAGDSLDITGTVVQDPSTQDSSIADPVTAALTATLRSDTDPASNPAQTYNAVFTLDGSTVSAMVQPSGHLVISGTTLAPGQSVLVGSQAVSINTAGAIVIGSSTIVPMTTGGVSDPAEQTAVFTLGGSTVSAMVQPSGHLVISGTTLAPGQTLSFGGQAVSLNSDGAIIAGTSTILPMTTGGVSDPAEQTAVFTLGGSTVSAMVQPSGHLVISGTTLAPGQTLSFGGQAVSLNSDGAIIAGTSTILPTTTGGVSDPAEQTAIFTLGSSTVSAMVQPSGHLVISGTTLAPSQTIFFGGQAVSLNSDSAIIAGTSTILPITTGGVSDPAEQTAIFTLSGSTVSAIVQPSGHLVISGTTLAPGQTISVGGQAVSLNSDGAIIAGTSTILQMATGGVSDLAEKTAIFTAGGSIYTAIEQATSFIVIGQTTLLAGGSAVTLGSQVFSAAASGLVVDGTSTIAPTTEATALSPSTMPAASSGGATATPSPATNVDAASTGAMSGGQGSVTAAGRPSLTTSAAARGLYRQIRGPRLCVPILFALVLWC